MMKTNVYSFILGIAISLFSISVNAQDYSYIPIVKPGLQIWTENYRDGLLKEYYEKFALTNEDTIIESETYKKLYLLHDSVFNPLTAECIGGLRENAQRQVYYKGKRIHGEESARGMIYDFSLSEGDTFFCPVPGMNFKYKVMSIDTIEFNQIKRRQFTIGVVWDSTGELALPNVGKWIEGIGNRQGLLFDMSINMMPGLNFAQLRCYDYQGDIQYHYGPAGCGSLLGLNTIEKDRAEIFVYPNPAKDDINFSCSFMIKDIEIYDIMGRKVFQIEVKDYSKIINVSTFNKGIYIAKINTERGLISKKFIVE